MRNNCRYHYEFVQYATDAVGQCRHRSSRIDFIVKFRLWLLYFELIQAPIVYLIHSNEGRLEKSEHWPLLIKNVAISNMGEWVGERKPKEIKKWYCYFLITPDSTCNKFRSSIKRRVTRNNNTIRDRRSFECVFQR